MPPAQENLAARAHGPPISRASQGSDTSAAARRATVSRNLPVAEELCEALGRDGWQVCHVGCFIKVPRWVAQYRQRLLGQSSRALIIHDPASFFVRFALLYRRCLGPGGTPYARSSSRLTKKSAGRRRAAASAFLSRHPKKTFSNARPDDGRLQFAAWTRGLLPELL